MTADLLNQVCDPAEAAEVRRILTANGLTEHELDEQIDYAHHTEPREAPPLDGDPLGLWQTLASAALIVVALAIIAAALYSAWIWGITP